MAEECIFCKIARGEIPTDFVYEDDDVVAFKDINPLAPVHILVIPRKHLPTLNDAATEDADILAKMQFAAAQIAKKFGIAESGYRTVVNVNADGGQVVFHLHLHIVGGHKLSIFV